MATDPPRRPSQYLVEDIRRHNPWWDPPGEDPASARSSLDAPAVRKGDFYYFLNHYEERTPSGGSDADPPGGDGAGEKRPEEGENAADDPGDGGTAGDDGDAELGEGRVFALTGRRGVGKTTLLHQFLDHCIGSLDFHPRQFLYVPFGDDPMYQLRAADQFRGAVNYYESRVLATVDADRHYLLLDDVHAIERKAGERSWAAELDDVLREDPARRVVLTGVTDSQVSDPLSEVGLDARVQLVLPEKFRDYFSRRRADRTDEEFGFRKYLVQFDEEGSLPVALERGDPEPFFEHLRTLYGESTAYRRDAKASLDRYLAYGGVLCLRSAGGDDAVDPGTVREYLGDVRLAVYREVPGIERVRNVGDLDRLLSLVAREGSADPFRYDYLTDLFGVDRRTLRGSYFDPLERLYLLTRCREYGNQRPRAVRLFVRDTGVVNAVTRTTLDDVRRSIDVEADLALTTAFDHTLRLEYGMYAGARSTFGTDAVGEYDGPGVGYRRTDDGIVDFVLDVPHPDGPTPVPVGLAYRPDTADRVADAVAAFREAFDTPLGLVVASDLAARTEGPEVVRPGVLRVPYWFYLLLC